MLLALLIRLWGRVVRLVLATQDTYISGWHTRDRRERLARWEAQ